MSNTCENSLLPTITLSNASVRYIYPIGIKNNGYCLIFNNYKFDNPDLNREGLIFNSQHFNKVFENLGFKVKTYENIKIEQIYRELNNVSKQVLLKSHKALIAIFLSYGNKSGIEDIEGNTISIESIVETFSNENCSHLIGRPKIFIFCSCRGDRNDEGVHHEEWVPSSGHLKSTDDIVLRPTYEDIIICYSATLGFTSVHNNVYGSVFGTVLGEMIARHAKDYDIEFILKLVQQQLASEDFQLDDGSYVKQSISYETKGWSKMFYFTPH